MASPSGHLGSVYELCEDDVPGASLRGRNPILLTVPELKCWLACRGASRRGRKPNLVLRVSEYIAAGLDKKIVNPDGGANIEGKKGFSCNRLALEEGRDTLTVIALFLYLTMVGKSLKSCQPCLSPPFITIYGALS